MKIADLYKIFTAFPSAETDTRKIKKNDIFFALKGPNFNGNKFAAKALAAGAAYCICDERPAANDDRIIRVDDVLTTLQQLAKFHRQQFDIPVIAITGSNGKTTTKELIHAVLSQELKCCTTKGNLNNHIGVPLTLLSIKSDAQVAVIEMGANHLHEIAAYCSYALPTHGLITNCGKAHLEGFGSEEGVRRGKGELYDFIASAKGTAFVNTDYEYLRSMSAEIKNKISYGTAAANYTGRVLHHANHIEVEITGGAEIPSIRTALAGAYNLPNILAAVAVGKTFGVSDDHIRKALEHYTPSNSRSQILRMGTNTILLDAYNANPSSMQAAIENFAAMAAEKKAVMLGSMKELGADSAAEHRALIVLLQKFHWNLAALAGEEFTDVPAGIPHFNTVDEMSLWFREQQLEDTLILIKGSRGMAMEKLLQ